MLGNNKQGYQQGFVHLLQQSFELSPSWIDSHRPYDCRNIPASRRFSAMTRYIEVKLGVLVLLVYQPGALFVLKH